MYLLIFNFFKVFLKEIETMLPFRGRFDSERHCQSDGEMLQTILCEKKCFLQNYKVSFWNQYLSSL